MISIESKLGYETLQQIVSSGHSRIPVYQEIEIPVNRARGGSGTLTPVRGGFLSALSRKASGTQTKSSIDDQRTLEGSVVNEKESTLTNVPRETPPWPHPSLQALCLRSRQQVFRRPPSSARRSLVLSSSSNVYCLTPRMRRLFATWSSTLCPPFRLTNLCLTCSMSSRKVARISPSSHPAPVTRPGSFVDLGGDNDPRKTQAVARSGTAARIETLGNIDEEKQLDDQTIKKSSFWSRHLRRHHRDHEKQGSLDLPAEAFDDDVDASAVATEMAQRDVPSVSSPLRTCSRS